jgi:hypothetical protein
MQPIKVKMPGVSPGVYSLDYVIKHKLDFDKAELHKAVIKKHVKQPKVRMDTRKANRVSHSESCRRWRLNHPERNRKSVDYWNAYFKGMTGFRRLFGDDNKTIKHKTPKHPRNCLFCGTTGSIEARNNKYICSLCMCNHAVAVT